MRVAIYMLIYFISLLLALWYIGGKQIEYVKQDYKDRQDYINSLK